MKTFSSLLIILFLLSGTLWGQSYGISPMSAGSSRMSSGTGIPMSLGSEDPHSYRGKLTAGRTVLDQGDYPEAIELLSQAEQLRKTGKVYEYLGDAYLANREFSKAFDTYLKGFYAYLTEKAPDSSRNVLRSLQYLKTPETSHAVQTAAGKLPPPKRSAE